MSSRRLHLAAALLSALLLTPASHAQEGMLEWEEMTSVALGETRTFGIYLPPSYGATDKRYPSFYVLHGKTLDARSHAGIRRALNRMTQNGEIGEMIAVLVNWDDSCCLDEYEPYIVRDLVEHVDTHYRTIPERESRGITGFSSGAFCTLHLAFQYPDVFSVAVPQALAAFSAAGNTVPPGALCWPLIDEGEQYVLDIEAYLDQPQRLTGVKMVHGVADPYALTSVEAARDYHQLLLDNGIDHNYVEHEGGHVFIDDESLPFLSDHLYPLNQIAQLRQSVVSATENLGVVWVDQPAPLAVDVELGPPAELVGVIRQLVLDLSPMAGSAQLPLNHMGSGQYRAASTIAPSCNGRYRFPIVAETAFPWDPQHTWYPLLTVELDVWPVGDESIYVEGCAPGWAASGRDLVDLDLYQADVVSSGSVACAVQGKKSFAGWAVDFQTDPQPHALGFSTLRFAIHPGDVALSDRERFGLNLAPQTRVDLLKENWVEMDRREWQLVEIPLESLELDGPLQIRLSGNFTGTFYLDDLTLVAAEPPPATAVIDRAAALPGATVLEQSYPNPFNSQTVIRFALPVGREVDLAVFNVAGQRLVTLARGWREAGMHTVSWNGLDARRVQASGLYLYRLVTDDHVGQTRRMLLLR